MDDGRFDAAARVIGRRGLLRGVAALAAGLAAGLRARPAGAVYGYCAPAGGICTYGVACCDATPCPMNLYGFVGVCGGGTYTPPEGEGDPREPNDGVALPHGAKRKKRKAKRRAYRQRRKRGRNKRRL